MEKTAATICFLLLNVFLAAATISVRGVGAAAATAVFVFGDSLLDVGNNNFLAGAPRANFPPYGIDFPHRVPTGRFTNGYNGVDFISEAVAGLRRSPPSFLSISNGRQMLRGVNFASAGAGILNTTGRHVITMEEQINDFSSVVANLTARTGKKLACATLKKSLVFMGVGSNDLFASAGFLIPGNSTQKNEIVAFVLSQFKSQLQAIYDLGARKFAVLGTAFLGCAPGVRAASPSGDCNQDLNDLSVRFKTATKGLLEELSTSLQGFKYSFVDFFEIGTEIFADPRKHGFSEVKAACCGSGRLNAEGPCVPNATLCSDRRQFLFWDADHPTQAAYKLLANLSLYGPPRFVNPVNIYELVKC